MPPQKATEPQIEYIRSLARKHRVGERDVLRLGVDHERVDELSREEASCLIGWLIRTPTGEITRQVAELNGQLPLIG